MISRQHVKYANSSDDRWKSKQYWTDGWTWKVGWMNDYLSTLFLQKCYKLNVRPGAHHPEHPSPMQTLWNKLCTYLSIFRNYGALRFAHTICYTVQYNTIRHSTTQLNTTKHNTMYYTVCCLRNLSQPGVKTRSKSRKIPAKFDSRIYGRWIEAPGDGLPIALNVTSTIIP